MSLDPKKFGLCAMCKHATKKQPKDKRMTYVICENYGENPFLSKFPRVPVRVCDGFKARPSVPQTEDSSYEHVEHAFETINVLASIKRIWGKCPLCLGVKPKHNDGCPVVIAVNAGIEFEDSPFVAPFP